MLTLALNVLLIAWPVSEIALVILRRAGGPGSRKQDRGTVVLLWVAIGLGVAVAVVARVFGLGRLPFEPRVVAATALTLLAGGLALRWWAILTLGRFFTVHVAVHEGHRLVQTGPYRRLRHPSYTGLLLCFVALGVAFGSWVSLVALLVPIGLGLGRCIVVEERAMAAEFGDEHARWRERTWRLLPFVW